MFCTHVPQHPQDGTTGACKENADASAEIRAEMIPEMPAELAARVAAGEQVWTTDQLREEFEVTGFAAPLVVARRKADGVVGSLMFTHNPRFYFGWEVDA